MFLEPTDALEINTIKNKAEGVDNINTKILKTLVNYIIFPLEHIVTCEPISVHVRTKGSEVFVSFQAETRNGAMKYNKSESITWVIY